MYSIQLDGTHILSKQGIIAIGYQARKRSKTTHMFIITDSQGISLSCSARILGNYNDAWKQEKQANKCKPLIVKVIPSDRGSIFLLDFITPLSFSTFFSSFGCIILPYSKKNLLKKHVFFLDFDRK